MFNMNNKLTFILMQCHLIASFLFCIVLLQVAQSINLFGSSQPRSQDF